MPTHSYQKANRMSKQIHTPASLRVLQIAVAIIQVFDIIIHAATDQLEILRVTSNVIILLWLAIVTTGKFNLKFLQIAATSIGAYLFLNVIFLAMAGMTNVEQGGGLRTTLFLLVFLTITLSTLLTYLQDRRIKN